MHREGHLVERIGCLPAAVRGANDGIVSAASRQKRHCAGRDRRAGGWGNVDGGREYVSVSSQSDTEKADLAREQTERVTDADADHIELVGIYVDRGLTPETAEEVARQLAANDLLGTHMRDELGI